MDAAQTCLVSVVTWQYLIVNFLNRDIIDFIPACVQVAWPPQTVYADG